MTVLRPTLLGALALVISSGIVMSPAMAAIGHHKPHRAHLASHAKLTKVAPRHEQKLPIIDTVARRPAPAVHRASLVPTRRTVSAAHHVPAPSLG